MSNKKSAFDPYKKSVQLPQRNAITPAKEEADKYNHLRPDITETGAQRHINSYLHAVISFLKLQSDWVTFEDIKTKINVDLEANKELLNALTNNDKIESQDNQLKYKFVYSVKSQKELLQLLKDNKDSPMGIDSSQLKESSPNVDQFIQELEQSQDLYTIDTKTSKILFYNDYRVEKTIDQDFKEMWQLIQVPDELTLKMEFERAGLKPMQVAESAEKKKQQLDLAEKKNKKNRRTKITNTHLPELH